MSRSRQHCLYCCCLASEGGRQCSSAAAATATAGVADQTDWSSTIVLLSTETGHLQTNKPKVTRNFDWTPVPREPELNTRKWYTLIHGSPRMVMCSL
jgi:hypothetical protein